MWTKLVATGLAKKSNTKKLFTFEPSISYGVLLTEQQSCPLPLLTSTTNNLEIVTKQRIEFGVGVCPPWVECKLSVVEEHLVQSAPRRILGSIPDVPDTRIYTQGIFPYGKVTHNHGGLFLVPKELHTKRTCHGGIRVRSLITTTKTHFSNG